jgi:hypothetical protein
MRNVGGPTPAVNTAINIVAALAGVVSAVYTVLTFHHQSGRKRRRRRSRHPQQQRTPDRQSRGGLPVNTRALGPLVLAGTIAFGWVRLVQYQFYDSLGVPERAAIGLPETFLHATIVLSLLLLPVVSAFLIIGPVQHPTHPYRWLQRAALLAIVLGSVAMSYYLFTVGWPRVGVWFFLPLAGASFTGLVLGLAFRSEWALTDMQLAWLAHRVTAIATGAVVVVLILVILVALALANSSVRRVTAGRPIETADVAAVIVGLRADCVQVDPAPGFFRSGMPRRAMLLGEADPFVVLYDPARRETLLVAQEGVSLAPDPSRPCLGS